MSEPLTADEREALKRWWAEPWTDRDQDMLLDALAEVVGRILAARTPTPGYLPDLAITVSPGGRPSNERDGECICDYNPDTTEGPLEDCPFHGRPYGYWVEATR